ncbi:hypothetical protein Lepto7375DRAFT_6778 [Leptolyngbya sp. PCC 7375]|nr:hypothetical protein Lepto7375DRAFT_6778 [Leptolyngbya sp. PCC 7375]
MQSLEENKSSIAQWCKHLIKRVKSSSLMLSTIVGLMGLLYPFGAQGNKSFDDLLMLLQLLFLLLWIGSQLQILDEKRQVLSEKQELVDINRQAIVQQEFKLQEVELQLQKIDLLEPVFSGASQIKVIQKKLESLQKESFEISRRRQEIDDWLNQQSVQVLRKNLISKTSLSFSLLTHLRYRFPSQWDDFEHIFRDLSEAQEWELRKGKSLWIVKLTYYYDFTCIWSMFLWAIIWNSFNQAIFRQTE